MEQPIIGRIEQLTHGSLPFNEKNIHSKENAAKNFSLETILKSHMNLLAEKAKNEHSAAGLCALTHAIVELAPLIQSLSDDGLVSYPVQVQMTMQDLTDLYRGRHLAQQQMLSDNETRLNQAR